ncbi:MAG TPA: class A beta-lactamase [Pyrinomonadaceae bacterium]|nr:class A beta-lactamase [Pyrinomonadaceae bacterium]
MTFALFKRLRRFPVPFCLVLVSVAAAQSQAGAQSPRACAPEQLRERMKEIARAVDGRVGAAAVVLDDKDEVIVSVNGSMDFPMQSVYKLPIGMAVLRAVDGGRLRLTQKVNVRPEDLVPERLHSPLRDANPRGGEFTLRELVRLMIAESDGTASDVLLGLAGGPEEVNAYLRGLGVEGVTVTTTERAMAQGDEQVQYSNWATPESMLTLLRALQEGRGLSRASRGLLLDFMLRSTPGPRRLKGMLPAGTPVAHKTGTSNTTEGITRATNDVGLVTLPDGRHMAVAVFVSDTKADADVREGVIAKIARAAWDCWTSERRRRGR